MEHAPRRAGVVLHVSSLPGGHGIGDFGPEAYRWIDVLKDMGIGIWQVLPLNPPGYGNSPYMPSSSFAGNPLFVSLDLLAQDGYLREEELAQEGVDLGADSYRVDFEKVAAYKLPLLKLAADRARAQGLAKSAAYKAFVAEHAAWLSSYSLFVVASDHYGAHWRDWPAELRDARGDVQKLKSFASEYSEEIARVEMIQYFFFSQWAALREAAHKAGVRIMGDLPIFPSMESAELWAHPELFDLDENYEQLHVAGCPPDGYSPTGQRWGNPMYRWDTIKETGYAWWIARMKTLSVLVDILRIDHFRGFESAWEIPADREDALEGRWVPGPGMDFFNAVAKAVPDIEIVAEDLGFLTPEVMQLLEDTGFPGMRVMHFAFEYGDYGRLNSDNIYLPHNIDEKAVYYSGTHDSETTRGWYEGLSEDMRSLIRNYLGRGDDGMVWHVIRTVLASRARYAMVPLQDILELDNCFRMNIPSTPSGNWEYRFLWDQVDYWRVDLMRNLIIDYGRYPCT